MALEFRVEPLANLDVHAALDMSVPVHTRLVFDCSNLDLEPTRQPIQPAWIKNYRDVQQPSEWRASWNIDNWGLIAAYQDGRRIGGVVLAFQTDGLNMLEGRHDRVIIWDIRVASHVRRAGVGRSLVERAIGWSRTRKATHLIVETQDINPGAFFFYRRAGFRLYSVRPDAYPELPNEVQLLLRRDFE